MVKEAYVVLKLLYFSTNTVMSVRQLCLSGMEHILIEIQIIITQREQIMLYK